MKLSHLREEYISMLFLTQHESDLNLLSSLTQLLHEFTNGFYTF